VEPIWIVDTETSYDKITEIGIAMVIPSGPRYVCAKPERHYIIKIGLEYHDLFGAQQILLNMGTRKGLWASYGHNDPRVLRQSFEDTGLQFPFGPTWLDIQPLYMAFQSKDRLPRKLKEATEDLCGRFLGAQHHADDDAYNAGRLLAALLNTYQKGAA